MCARKARCGVCVCVSVCSGCVRVTVMNEREDKNVRARNRRGERGEKLECVLRVGDDVLPESRTRPSRPRAHMCACPARRVTSVRGGELDTATSGPSSSMAVGDRRTRARARSLSGVGGVAGRERAKKVSSTGQRRRPRRRRRRRRTRSAAAAAVRAFPPVPLAGRRLADTPPHPLPAPNGTLGRRCRRRQRAPRPTLDDAAVYPRVAFRSRLRCCHLLCARKTNGPRPSKRVQRERSRRRHAPPDRAAHIVTGRYESTTRHLVITTGVELPNLRVREYVKTDTRNYVNTSGVTVRIRETFVRMSTASTRRIYV